MQNMSGKSGKFVRLCNDYYEGGKMVPLEEWHQHITNPKDPWFKSVGTYSQEQVEQFKAQRGQLKPNAKGEGSVAGMRNIPTNYLVFDFDGVKANNNLKPDEVIAKMYLAKAQTIETIDKLASLGIPSNQYNITFSGSKGFSIELFTDKFFSSKEFRTVAENLAGHLETWDTSLYDENQLMRVPGTRHKTSGLYKTPLTEQEIKSLTLDQIKEKAKVRQDIEWNEFPNALPQELFKSKVKEKPKKAEFDGDLDFSTNTLGMPNWKFAILHGFFPPGKRHDCMLALASYFKGAGFPMEVTQNMVFEASRLQYERNMDYYKEDPTDEGELTRTIQHIYGPTWTGGTFAYETNEKLKKSILDLFPEESLLEDQEEVNKPIKFADEILKGFKKFSNEIDKNKILTGIPEVDRNIMLTTGAMHGILGSPGSGKTALCLNMLANNSRLGLPCMFFSLDMSENLIGGKLMARQNPIGFRELTEKYKAGVDLSDTEHLVQEDFKNVAFYSKSSTSVKDMKIQILKHQKEIGQKVKLVLVDYLELIAGPYSDATANSAHHAVHLKDLATDLDICLIILVQPQKSAGDASYPLTNMRQVKGASVLEQNFRNVLGIYREGFSPDTPELDRFMTIKGLKSSFEGLFSVDVGWDGRTGKVYTLNSEGHAQLKKIRDQKKEKKEAEEGGGKW